jgi:hypothetical protein
LSAAYLPTNRRPRLTEVDVHPPGEVLQKPAATSDGFEVLGLTPQLPSSTPGQPSDGPEPPSPASFARKAYIHGLRTFTWKAEDPDADSLRYSVWCRRLGEDGPGQLLRSGLTDGVLAWDTRSLSDGRYVLAVEVSDAPGNPAGLALMDKRESLPFDVDNTPPQISVAIRPGHPTSVRVEARDDASSIQRCEYASDGSTWNEIYPVDGVGGARSESFEFTLPAQVAEPKRETAVRVFDRLGNVAYAHVAIP